jgi:uncharacterized membrane protein YgaE (UPF0421/DUF939 family)
MRDENVLGLALGIGVVIGIVLSCMVFLVYQHVHITIG